MLSEIIQQLEQHITQIAATGPVATDSARLDISTHSKSGYQYARLREGDQFKACGRVGSEPYQVVLASLHRRDKIAHLRQAIFSLQQADKLSALLPELALPISPKSSPVTAPSIRQPATPSATKKSTKKSTRRQRLYTHVKTRQGSVVHAVLGKDKSGAWHTAALCGATPPKRDRMGWEFPEHDDGITCAQCRRKLPANGKRYIPSF
ncbi:MAG: hypothetical protein AAFR25_01530 [Cyanobacteria bacterium J06629_19]